MPPVIPQHLEIAKKRMRQGLHPAVLAAVQRAAPSPGAGRQAYEGTAVNPGHARPVPPGRSAFAAADPLAGQRYRSFVQQDPEGGLREVHVYGSGANRQVRAFTPKNVAPSVL